MEAVKRSEGHMTNKVGDEWKGPAALQWTVHLKVQVVRQKVKKGGAIPARALSSTIGTFPFGGDRGLGGQS